MAKSGHYNNSDARGGSPSNQAGHDKSMSRVDAGTKHLTSPSGGAKTLPGEQGPHEKTRHGKSSMPIVKKVASGSNY